MAEAHVALAGGPLDGQWFTSEDWAIRVTAAQRTGIGSAPQYAPTGVVLTHPSDHAKLRDLRADEWRFMP